MFVSTAVFLPSYFGIFFVSAALVGYVSQNYMDKRPGIWGSPEHPLSVGDPNMAQADNLYMILSPSFTRMSNHEIDDLVYSSMYLGKIFRIMIGGTTMVLNAMLIFVIKSDVELSKKREMILPCHLAFIEILLGAADFANFFRFSYITIMGEAGGKASSLFCMATTQMIFWLAALRNRCVCLVCIAFDRYIAIKHPMKYGGLGKGYYRALSLIIWGSFVWILLLCFALARYNDSRFDYQIHVGLHCHNGIAVYGYFFAQFVEVWRVGSCVIVGLFYVLVIAELRKYTKSVGYEEIKKNAMDRQARITRTLGWVMLSTVFLDPVFPTMWFSINHFEMDFGSALVQNMANVGTYIEYFSRGNNLGIFYKKNEEFKRGFLRKFGIGKNQVGPAGTSMGPPKSTMAGGRATTHY